MRDPYEVLGVSRTASAGDIKSAFRKLAKKLHPDANKHDPKAASRFSELNAAYEILGEADKRKAFDGGEIDAEGKPRFRGYEGFGAGAGGGPGFAQDGNFESFHFGPEGFQRSTSRARSVARAAAAASKISSRKCSAAAGGKAAGAAVRHSSRRSLTVAVPTSPARSRSRCRRLPKACRCACGCRPARMSMRKFRPVSPAASRSGSRARAWPVRAAPATP